MECDFTPIHVNLRPYVKALIQHEFGLTHQKCEIDQITTGSNRIDFESGDRFRVKVPYYKKSLNWYVIMNGDDCYEPPDFIMEDDQFTMFFENEFELHVPNLVNWNPKDSKCLLNVVLEILELYKKHQIKILQLNKSLQRYLFEYETLTQLNRMTLSKDLDICIDQINRNVVTSFYMNLDVDVSLLPVCLPQNNQNKAVLVVEFISNGKTNPQLTICHQLEEVLGSNFSQPPLSAETALVDYILIVTEFLKKKINDTVIKLKQRKMLYSCLLQRIERALLYGDSILFREMSFLLESKGFYYTVLVNIPANYPDDPPKVQIQFIHSIKNGLRKLDIKYNSQMTGEEVSNNILTSVQNVIDQDTANYV